MLVDKCHKEHKKFRESINSPFWLTKCKKKRSRRAEALANILVNLFAIVRNRMKFWARGPDMRSHRASKADQKSAEGPSRQMLTMRHSSSGVFGTKYYKLKSII